VSGFNNDAAIGVGAADWPFSVVPNSHQGVEVWLCSRYLIKAPVKKTQASRQRNSLEFPDQTTSETSITMKIFILVLVAAAFSVSDAGKFWILSFSV
jgi:hypothetical protein